jgi:hypothetical protein
MNFLNARHILLLSLLLFLLSCKKNFMGNPSSNPTIYIAGSIPGHIGNIDFNSYPVLWVNGKLTQLSSFYGYADKVFLSGNDVYVVGIDSVVSSSAYILPYDGIYVYWKNGVQDSVGLADQNIDNPSIPSMAISGNNIYYSGYDNYWENGSPVSFSGLSNDGSISSMFVDGSNIYMSGTDSVGDAVYWRNGQLNVLDSYNQAVSGYPKTTHCITVSGNDVYVGGENDSLTMGMYWKNGVPTYLQTTESGYSVGPVLSILISGTDVYMLANLVADNNGFQYSPAYWKNGVEHDLPLNWGATSGYANSIFIYNNDVYVAGITNSDPPQDINPKVVYWVNGVEHLVDSSPGAIAYSIFVK